MGSAQTFGGGLTRKYAMSVNPSPFQEYISETKILILLILLEYLIRILNIRILILLIFDAEIRIHTNCRL